ncbi:unnamed protein product [Allacma fusca]|uniref:Peptidase S1 domain-containing protein n=1 Tax=Allacma fusca TaxID=39272 RepID=A0A8J2J6J4_9HEXA|nr:unnamed protein product [Allacma fusca]
MLYSDSQSSLLVLETSSNQMPNAIKTTSRPICTTSANATICEGDSGGSINHKDDRGRYYAVGINSYGLSHCGSSDNVNVMVKIAMYLRWIEKHTGEKFCKK